MKNISIILAGLGVLVLLAFTNVSHPTHSKDMKDSIYNFNVTTIDGQQKPMADYKGKVLLIVNVASKCGFTPQYEGLEAIYKEYKDQGFEVLGFPCNQFGSQEPGTEQDIKSFCSLTYNVSFPMFSKVDVNGDNTHPLYEYLKNEKSGVLGSKAIKWNFTKFLVDKEGNVIERYASATKPESITEKIEALLN